MKELVKRNRKMVEAFLKEQAELIQLFKNEVEQIKNFVTERAIGKTEVDIAELSVEISDKFNARLIRFCDYEIEFDGFIVKIGRKYSKVENKYVYNSVNVVYDFIELYTDEN